MAGVPYNPLAASLDPKRRKENPIASALMASTQKAVDDFNASPFSQALNSDINRNVSAVASALMAPGDALSGKYNYEELTPNGYYTPLNSGLLDAASNMAGVVNLSSLPIPRPVNSLGMGGTNYLRSLSDEVPLLHREMNSERANQLIEGNIRAPWGQERMYWSDTPELARGQAENVGVKMTMRTDGVMGKTDTSSKPGLEFVRAMGGGKEYITTDGVNFKNVDTISISPLVNEYGTPDDKRLLNRLRSLLDSGEWTSSSPDGFVTVYQRVKR